MLIASWLEDVYVDCELVGIYILIVSWLEDKC